MLVAQDPCGSQRTRDSVCDRFGMPTACFYFVV